MHPTFSLSLLCLCCCSLLREWIGLAVSEWAPPQPGEAAQPLAGFDSLHRVEGSALVLLCSTDVEVRRLGVELLRTASDLHRTLSSPPQPSSKRTTMHAPTDELGAAGRRSSLQSVGGGGLASSRRSTTAHGAAAGGAGLESVPSTPGGSPRPVYVAGILEK